MLFEIDDQHINDLQRESIEKMLATLPWSSRADITIRKDAQDHSFEADWLKHIKVVGGSGGGG